MNQNIFDPYLSSMNFLNEACILYPNAISFGSGRPKEEFFDVEQTIAGIQNYVGLQQGELQAEWNHLGQYNKTKGIINEEISRLLKNDEKIIVDAENIIVTDGAQEAMAIIINTLFDQNDVLLVSDPSYVGFMGYAKIAGIDIRVVKRTKTSIDFEDLEKTIWQIQQEHKKPRAIYEVPNFHNPTGTSMTLLERKQLLGMAEQYDFYIIEDNPYGYFAFDGERDLPLKALDDKQRVIYIGSFSKSIFPSVRLGYLIADQEQMVNGKMIKLIEACKKVKSFITVNTSTLLQSMIAETIIKENYSLINYCKEKVLYCKRNRDIIAEEIKRTFDFAKDWEKPAGGFFTTLQIPFEPTHERIQKAAREYGVIVCPMQMFCIDPKNGEHTLRLSYSYMTPEEIVEGIRRLHFFIEMERT